MGSEDMANSTIPPEAEKVLAKIEDKQKIYKRNMIIAFGALVCCLAAVLVVIGLDFIFMLNWLPFILTGIGYTFLVSTLAIALACILAVAGALGGRRDSGTGFSGLEGSIYLFEESDQCAKDLSRECEGFDDPERRHAGIFYFGQASRLCRR